MVGKLHETLMKSQKILNSFLQIAKVSLNDMEILRTIDATLPLLQRFVREKNSGWILFPTSVERQDDLNDVLLCSTYIANETVSTGNDSLAPCIQGIL